MLAIDIGNTLVKSALFKGDSPEKIYSMPTKLSSKRGSYLASLLKEVPDITEDIIISSVCKDAAEIIASDIDKHIGLNPFIVTRDTEMGIKNLYLTKVSLGIDRIINAAAAYHLYSKARQVPAVVIDMGTATTIDYVTKDGEFVGGAIAPGMISAYKGLLSMARALPEVELEPPNNIIGTTTDTCLRSGVVLGHKAMIEAMARMVAEAGHGHNPMVIVTGGISLIISNILDPSFIHDPWLSLKGLYRIGKINGLK